MNVKLVFTFLCCLLFFNGQSQTPTAFFQQGNAAYNGGNYELAIQKYSAILEQGQESAQLYYNLGNAHYRIGNVAESVFYFEKAFQLAPDDESIVNNRRFANNMTLDSIEKLPTSQIDQTKNAILNRFSLDQWAYFTLFFAWLCMFVFLGYLFSDRIFLKRLFFTGGIVIFLFLIGLLWFTQNKHQSQKRVKGVVFASEAQVWAEPNKRAEVFFLLHEGTTLEVTDELGDWVAIKLDNGSGGWLERNSIRTLDQILGE